MSSWLVSLSLSTGVAGYVPSNSTVTSSITLVNPHTYPITVNVNIVNPRHFYLAQDAVQVEDIS